MSALFQKLLDVDWTSPTNILSALGVIILLGSYFLGLSHGSKPKELVCKEEIKLLDAQSAQISEMQKQSHKELQGAQISCVKREQDICTQRLDTFRDNLTRLRCKICKAGAK